VRKLRQCISEVLGGHGKRLVVQCVRCIGGGTKLPDSVLAQGAAFTRPETARFPLARRQVRAAAIVRHSISVGFMGGPVVTLIERGETLLARGELAPGNGTTDTSRNSAIGSLFTFA
jgi:hypothetical protein